MPAVLLTPTEIDERIRQYIKDHLLLETRHTQNRLEIVIKLSNDDGYNAEEICRDFIDYSDVIRVIKDELN